MTDLGMRRLTSGHFVQCETFRNPRLLLGHSKCLSVCDIKECCWCNTEDSHAFLTQGLSFATKLRIPATKKIITWPKNK